jgi:TetR/AcrR family transcriptional regulator, cholesterol catabolism regulator
MVEEQQMGAAVLELVGEPEISDAKQRVLDMAERLFMDKGYASITLRDLAEALNIRQASLYYHFPAGKEQLYVEVVTRVFERHRGGLERAILAAPPDLRSALLAASAWLGSQPPVNFLGMMHSDLPALSQSGAQVVSRTAYTAMFGPLRAALADAHARGEVEALNPDLMAGFFIALMDGITFSLTQQNHLPREALVTAAVDLMLNGVTPRPGTSAVAANRQDGDTRGA